MSDGQSLLDEMSRPIKNAFGKDITPDYAAQIKRIQRSLEELQERKMRCDELADVRRLKLQQLLQLRTCERDCDQVRICHVVVTWLEFMHKHDRARCVLYPASEIKKKYITPHLPSQPPHKKRETYTHAQCRHMLSTRACTQLKVYTDRPTHI